jgi:paraquat-inducible protein B
MPLQQVKPASSQEVILSYIRAAKEIKANSQQEISCLIQVLKGRNSEIRDLKAEAINAKKHIDKHNSEFLKFRNILRELKAQLAKNDLSNDALYGPEIMSLKKEKDKYECLYQQEYNNSQKFQSRAVAMSAQVIERQRKIYHLESQLLESEHKRLILESLQVLAARKQGEKSLKDNIDSMFKKLRDAVQFCQQRLKVS